MIGGGPSAPEQFARISLPKPPVYISANGHAFKMGVRADYIWCKDHARCLPHRFRRGTPQFMEDELREYGVPIIGPNYWTDYRAIEWPINNANSGMQALAVAALMGCRPIIGVGFDCFQGPTYFHDPTNDNVSNGKRQHYWTGRYRVLKAALDGAAIRGFDDSVLARVFTPVCLNEQFSGIPALPTILQRYQNRPTVRVRALRAFQDSYAKSATVPAGYIMASDEAEAARLCRLGLAARLDIAPPVD